MPNIVVGIDGSPSSRQALRLAVQEAARRGDVVRAVTAWHVPVMTYANGFAPMIDASVFKDNAKRLLDAELAALGTAAEGVTIQGTTREGSAAQVLLDEAQGADLLVVGSRGLGGFSGLLLGSVSQQCVHHATCPVLIARDPAHDAADA
jgi:nucleotide-binding universal stress UspA family protein